MPTRLTILCDNSVISQFGLIGEHGFACYIETAAGNYLFDTGQGQGILSNARILQKDLAGLKAIALSHGHYDHTGGLPDVLHQSGPIDVFAHPALFDQRFRTTGNLQRFIGIPHRRAYLEALGARFRLSTTLTEIGPGAYLTGEIPRETSFEKGDGRMTAVTAAGETMRPDPLRDDLSLVVESQRGLILVLGCAHAGMVNIMRYVLRELGRDSIYAVIGGTHLGFADDEQFEQTVAALDALRIEKFGVSHCTGLHRAAQLHARLGERFFFGAVGTVLEG